MIRRKVCRGHALRIAIGITILIFLSGEGAIALSNDGGSWQYYRAITINNPGGALSDYQMLVTLDSTNFPTAAQNDGDDIRFTDAGGVELSYWIESWDYAGRSAKIWVNMTGVPTGSSEIWLYYGNPSAVGASNVIGTFLREIDGVAGSWSFDEGMGTTAHDNSGNGNDGNLINRPIWVDGKFGQALSFDGVDDGVTVPHNVNLQHNGNYTIEMWIYVNSFVNSIPSPLGSINTAYFRYLCKHLLN